MIAPIRHSSIRDIIVSRGIDWQFSDEFLILSGPVGPAFEAPVRPGFFCVGMITGGTIIGSVNLEDYELKKDTLIVIDPSQIFQLRKVSARASGCFIFFTRNFIAGHQAEMSFLQSTFLGQYRQSGVRLQSPDTQRLKRLFADSFAYLQGNDNPNRSAIARHLAVILLLEVDALFQHRHAHFALRSSRSEQLDQQFHRLLHQHFRTQRHVQFYAEQLFVSPGHLSATIRAVSGKAPGELIDERVLLEAKALLLAAATVAEVADSLHFSDQFAFSKFFKKHTGIPPSHFARRQEGAA
jgi:AraC-like DNA-binding protein